MELFHTARATRARRRAAHAEHRRGRAHGAQADSDPKLEILNNDVIRCTHGAAVGPVDQEMIFYLASRGLDQATAEQLIVEGFFQSTLKKLEMPAVEAALWAAIDEREKSADAPRE